jgi:O-acetyl-ADP-ribose deacetylase (regulator of RNase III)
MSIEHRRGDLFASGLPALAHGVNCRGAMGAGIARGFRDRWPDMYMTYREACAKGALQPGQVLTWEDERTGTVIFNLATQRLTGPDVQPWAIVTATGQMILAARNRGIKQVGMPMIGCGIGGLRPGVLWACLEPFYGAPVDLIVCEYVPAEGARP